MSEMGFNCAVKGKKPAPIAQFWLATKEKKYKRVSKRKENTLGPESVFFSSPRNYYPGSLWVFMKTVVKWFYARYFNL